MIQLPNGTWEQKWVDINSSLPDIIPANRDSGFVVWVQQEVAKGNVSVADPTNFVAARTQYEATQKSFRFDERGERRRTADAGRTFKIRQNP